VAIATRTALPVHAARLEAAGRLTVIGPADLVFDARDCAELLRARRGAEPPAAEVDAVLEATEGWPLGVAAAALAGGAALDGHAPAADGRAFAFLAEELLDRLPAELAGHLEDSALPLELDAVTIAALELPEGFVDDVRERGLFLGSAGAAPGAARYHPLFRALLLRRAEERPDAARRAALHARLAAALQADGRPGAAVDHWFAAGRDGEAAEAIAAAGATLTRTAPERVLGWLARLPDSVRARPELELLEGTTVNAGGHEPAHAIALLRAAVAGFEQRADRGGTWLARFLLADALIWSGVPEDVIALADGFDAPEAADLPTAPATALVAAVALAQLRRIAEAQVLAQRVFAHPHGGVWAARCAWQGLFVHLPAGRLDEALAAVDDDLRDFPREDPLMSLAYPLAYRAQVLEERGDEEEALAAGAASEAEVRRTALGGFVVSLVCARRAMLLARRGQLGEATAEIERAEAAVVRSWWRADVEIARACIAVARGEAAAAGAAAERALAALAAAPDYERARGAAWLAPPLVEAGLAGRAREVVDRTLQGLGEHVSPVRLLALRAWLRHGAGDEQGAWEDLPEALDRAGDQARHLVRREWPRLETLLWQALEHGVVEPGPVVAAVTGAFPGGEAALPLTRHPVAVVRAEAVVAVAAAGSPAAAARLAELANDPDARVAAAARGAAESTRRRPPSLSFRVLGPFAVRRGSWTVDDTAWKRRIAQRVVRLLLVHRPDPVPEDVLFEALWPDRPATAARRSLQVAVSCARAVLDPLGAERSLLEGSGRAYRLVLGDRDAVDADVFLAAAERALQATAQRRRMLERAAELWGGDPLPEERYSDWATVFRERLIDRYADVLSALADACEEQDDRPAAQAAARRLVELDPLDESAHRRAMLAYARAGRRAHALRQFLECRKQLVEELGLEPSEATIALQRRILVGEAV
jgi:DNA-binding SARP family transcriptional activator